MLTPSHPTEFNEAAVAAIRNPKARVSITWTDPYLDASIVASAPFQENRICYPKQTADMIETVPYKWLHADPVTPPLSAKLGFYFNSWSKGNGTSDKNSGNMASFPEGAFQNCTFNNFGVGEGFLYNAGDGHLLLGSNNNYIEIEQLLSFLDQTQKFSIEMWINADAIDTLLTLFELRVDDSHKIFAGTSSTGDGLLWCAVADGDANSYAYWGWAANGAQAGTWYHVVWVFDGTGATNPDKLRLYFNGDYKASSYAGNIPTTTADFTTEKARIGQGATWGSFLGKIGMFVLHDDALTAADITKYYSYGRDFNSKAFNKGDSMHVGAGTAVLSNNLHPAPAPELYAVDFQMGWWGKDHCDGSGDFSVPQVLTIHFSSRPVLTLRVVGDSAWGEYPVAFVIKVLDGAAATLYTNTVTSNAAVVWVDDISSLNISDAEYVVISITKWSDPFRVVKIVEAYTSIVSIYDGDEIVKMSINEEMEIKDGTLPIGNISCNELDLSLNNVDDKFFPANTDEVLYTQVKKNRKIIAEIGFVLASGETEYVPMGVFWSGDWKTKENGTVASTSARDRMELLRKMTFYPSILYENYTLKELAEVILDDAQLEMPDLNYNVDSELSDYVIPWGWFEKKSHFEHLKQIAGSCLGRVFCDRNGIVQVLGMATEGSSVHEITSDNYFERTQPAASEDVANVIESTTKPFVPNTSPTTDVYVSSEDLWADIGIKTVNIFYKEPPIVDASASLDLSMDDPAVATISGNTLYYAWGAKIVIICTTAGWFRIKIDGTEFNTDGAITVIKEDEDSIRDFGKQRYEIKKNNFIQNEDIAEIMAVKLLEVYKHPFKDVELNWRGNPRIELSDPLTIPECVKGTVNQKGIFRTTRQKFDFDGGLKSVLEGRKIIGAVLYSYQDTDGVALVWQDTDGATIKIQG